ncbi:MAG: preprotein translocase subunit SecY [Clostridia bacterium]|nr:preprotein translocase subunit SecY [Clostridia bacterium]
MFRTLANAWKIPDLRKKILYTALLLVVFRFGSIIPVPGLDKEMVKAIVDGASDTLFGLFNTFSGGAFANATIFAMSITPYINSSIIMQLLTVAVPALERLSKEGEEGRKKIASITRYVTVILGFIQAAGLYAALSAQRAITTSGFLSFITITFTFTAGTAFLMWLGEKITEKGIGNGVSLIIFIGIISRGSELVNAAISSVQASNYSIMSFVTIVLVVIAAIIMIAFVITINEGERRLPVQYAKRMQGRKMYGGQSTYIPLKVAMAGVMPIIFAMSILSFPATIANLMGAQPAANTFWGKFLALFSQTHWVYAIIYFLLVIFFTYFYTSIQFNPIEIANNMKRNGGFILGIRPGKPTSDYIQKILTRVTLIGAIALAIIAVIPVLASVFTHSNIGIGGTSVLIVVSVALETVKQIESQMLMRHYKGFLE